MDGTDPGQPPPATSSDAAASTEVPAEVVDTPVSEGPESSRPSEKALGKRKEDDSELPATITPLPTPLITNTKEKRITRSSLGGAGTTNGSVGSHGNGLGSTSRQGSDAGGSEGASYRPHLPLSTRILLTSSLPNDVVHHPPLETDLGWSFGEEPCPIPPIEPLPDSIPSYRLLDKAGDPSLGRSRHATGPEVDTSDAYYQRLHRYPETLEKRSARLERDRLIHERNKLIYELEELKGRGWVYIGAQGGKGAEERRKRIREGEIKLSRYDALLPQQPRKSNALNAGISAVEASTTTGQSSNSRAQSPAAANGRPSSRPATQRLSTPLSAYGDGSTTIKIRFSQGGTSSNSASHPTSKSTEARKPASRARESTNDLELDLGPRDYGLTQSGFRKRDRAAEHARALERQRLGLPIKGKVSDLIEARQGKSPEAASKSNAEGMKKRDRSSRDRRASRGDSMSKVDTGGDKIAPPAKPKRIRLKDSFFTSPALRDTYFPSSSSFSNSTSATSNGTGARRSSARTSYAFGQRLPEPVLLRQVEFELHGAGLDEMVLKREGAKDKVAFEGRVVPKSAIDVLSRGPIKHDSVNTGNEAKTVARRKSTTTLNADAEPVKIVLKEEEKVVGIQPPSQEDIDMIEEST